MDVQACVTVPSVLVFSLYLLPAHTELISASLMHQLQFGMSNLLISNTVLYILFICWTLLAVNNRYLLIYFEFEIFICETFRTDETSRNSPWGPQL